MEMGTVMLKTICESLNGYDEPVSYPQIAQLIEDSRGKIFDFEYPIFDETYRKVLETKIIKHYFTRQICEETYGMWKLRLDTKMNEVMPYFNQLYRSEMIEINPLYNVNFTKTRKDSGGDMRVITENGEDERNENRNRDVSGTGTKSDTLSGSGNAQTDNSRGETFQTNDNQTSKIDESRKQMYSDTPQGTLTNVEDGTYLTNATVNKDANESTVKTENKHLTTGQDVNKSNSVYNEQNDNETSFENNEAETRDSSGNYNKNVTDNITTTREYIEMLTGNHGKNESEMLIEYRNTFLNIDLQVIDELETLFYGLW